MELLNEVNIIAYLTEQGIIKSGEEVAIVELTGGVSNTVLSITTSDRNLVLKQALPELKVAERWEADQRRAIVEADGLQLFHKLNPHQVPELVFLNSERIARIIVRQGASICRDYPKQLRKNVHDFAHMSTILPIKIGQNVQGFV